MVTLGVSDLERARRFYCDGLGWRPTGNNKNVVFLAMQGGTVLALYPRHLLAEDAGVGPPGEGGGFGGVTLAQNVASKAEVRGALAAAELAGGRILKPAQDTFWGGYGGYFADPDGYPWEIAWNPYWRLTPDGGVELG